MTLKKALDVVQQALKPALDICAQKQNDQSPVLKSFETVLKRFE